MEYPVLWVEWIGYLNCHVPFVIVCIIIGGAALRRLNNYKNVCLDLFQPYDDY